MKGDMKNLAFTANSVFSFNLSTNAYKR